VVNLVSTADRRVRGMLVGGAALAALPLLLNLRDSVAYLVGYLHIGYATAFVIISLILEGSPWLMWVFPWAIPVEATVMYVVAIFGISVCAGW
jgi:hypothetical protein